MEVITWDGADRATVDYLRRLFAVTGKTPLVTADVVDILEDVRERMRTRLLGILFSQSLDIVARNIGTPADLELGNEGVADVLRTFEAERPGFPGFAMIPRLSELLDFPCFILVERMDDVVVITLRRPAQLNALTDLVNDEILAVLRQYQDDPSVSGFVLTGYGTKAFCAGADIGRFPEMLGDAAASAQYARDSSRLLEYMDGMEKPVVAAVVSALEDDYQALVEAAAAQARDLVGKVPLAEPDRAGLSGDAVLTLRAARSRGHGCLRYAGELPSTGDSPRPRFSMVTGRVPR